MNDSTKRQSYDLGLTNSAFSESAQNTYSDTQQSNDYTNNFYRNKYSPVLSRWYGFKKPKDDMRFDFMYEQESQLTKLLKNVYFKIGLVLVIVFAFDMVRYSKR